jgi:hypothetical protein
MKTLALILSFYIGLLNVQPAAMMVYSSLSSAKDKSCEHSCCKHKKMNNCKEDKKQSSNNCCDDGVCNPFAQCSCCFGYTYSQSEFTFLTFANISTYVAFKDTEVLSNFNSSCFHPPEVA